MVKNKLCLVLSIAAAMGLTACGGGDGDADKNVVRNLFAVGDVVDALEDDGAVEGDVSKNDRGEGLTFALVNGSAPAHGTLVFNADGTFTYTPEANYHGKDTFSYVATQTATGDTATALVTMNVKNDYEELEEYGWTLVWSDEFDSTALDTSTWAGVNASVSDGALMLNAIDGATSSAKLLTPLRGGRIEASIQVPDGNNIFSVFSLMPMADMFDGENRLAGMESNGDRIIAGAHYGLGLVSAVELNAPTFAAAKIEYQNYAIEWNEKQIRWYVDGLHVHTVNPLNTWS
jgi:VCBS repeat-containing protein